MSNRKDKWGVYETAEEIAALQKKLGRVAVAIEGRCGAGKTTLAAALSDLLSADIVHMDDFFLPPELRTPERFLEAGGNIHYERFQEEIIERFKQKQPVKYQVFDCTVMDYGAWILGTNSDILIVEGVYSLHPMFANWQAYSIFCDVEQEEQERRLRKREGEEGWRRFFTRWIPLEETYFETCRVREQCTRIKWMK